jgi:uncharacterized protein DUF6851/vanadium-dependent haloperoxidase-like protein
MSQEDPVDSEAGTTHVFSRSRLLRAAAGGGVVLLLPGRALAREAQTRYATTADAGNVVLQWNNALLQGVRESSLGPPMVSRALAVAHTCIYDAWAAYDRVAVGTRLGATLRRPVREHRLERKIEAISYAAYRAAVDLFPGSRAGVFDPLLASIGLDPHNSSQDTTEPAGIGNVAAGAVLAYRHRDGANQLGDEPGGKPGVPYSDYTGYVPTNAPMDVRAPLDPATVLDANRWQPLTFVNGAGAVVTPSFVGPHWQHVRPFAAASSADLRSTTGPARVGSPAFVTQAEELIAISAALTDEQKVIAEYWADGPRSELPPGHWNLLAQQVAHRDRTGSSERDLDQAVKLFFALTNAIFDAGCCAWDNKVAFDSVRPITAIRWLFQGRLITAWGGPGRGVQTIAGEEWFPYQPTSFPTPPFAEYSSGHSNFSAAGAEVLRLFTGSDRFGGSATVPRRSSKVEPGLTPANDVTLRWPTFSDAAAEAGLSRRYGGIHFLQGDLDARATGRVAARRCWAKAQSFFGGTAPGPAYVSASTGAGRTDG